MLDTTNENLIEKVVALRVAVPGEPVSQHNGRVTAVNDSSITIVNTLENTADLVVTTYNLKYVVLIQRIETVELEVEAVKEKTK